MSRHDIHNQKKDSILEQAIKALIAKHDCGCEKEECDCEDEELTLSNLVVPKQEDYVDFGEKAEEHELSAAEYGGKKVTLNKPFRTPGKKKKFAVYVKKPDGKIVIVRFGDPNMSIKKHIPERRKNFRARHGCDNPGPKWKPKWWSCQWSW
jgi:hypothetical protein